MKVARLAFVLLVVSFNASMSVDAQKIKVWVLDASDGRSYGDIEIRSFCEEGGTSSPAQSMKTNAYGLAEVPFTCASGTKLKVSTHIEGDKLSECGEMEGQTLEQLLKVGYISDPRAAGGIWCSAKVSKKMRPVPGAVVLFVKNPRWSPAHVVP